MWSLNKRFLSFLIFLVSFTSLTNAFWQSGWSPAPITISEAGQDAQYPQVAMDATGNRIAVWYRSDGSNNRVQASHFTSFSVPCMPKS